MHQSIDLFELLQNMRFSTILKNTTMGNACPAIAPEDTRWSPKVPSEAMRLWSHGVIKGSWRAIGCNRWPSGGHAWFRLVFNA